MRKVYWKKLDYARYRLPYTAIYSFQYICTRDDFCFTISLQVGFTIKILPRITLPKMFQEFGVISIPQSFNTHSHVKISVSRLLYYLALQELPKNHFITKKFWIIHPTLSSSLLMLLRLNREYLYWIVCSSMSYNTSKSMSFFQQKPSSGKCKTGYRERKNKY